MSSQVYVAAIADATASRLLPPARRARLQAELRAALPDLNRRYRRALAARFAVTLGDELQGLLTRPAPVWDVAHFIRARFPEIAWVVACGRGPISTPLAAPRPRVRRAVRARAARRAAGRRAGARRGGLLPRGARRVKARAVDLRS